MNNIQNAINKGELTTLEGKMINWLLTDGYYAEKHFSDVDVNDVAKGLSIPVNSVKGILGSLVKKSYLYTDNESGYEIIYAKEKCYQLDDEYENKWEE